MPYTLKPELIQRICPLVDQGLNGTQIAKAVGIGERQARWYAEQIRAGRTSPNGATPDQDSPSTTLDDVDLGRIHLQGETQARAQLDRQVIKDYVEAMTEGAIFPPVVLFFDGDEGFYIGDGFHRIEAAKQVGFITIKAEVRQGGQREAKLYAAGANQIHGLRRSNADKQRAVQLLLRDDEWQRWSDRQIARHCGVTHPFVAKLREDLSGNGYQMPKPRQVRRGETVYEMDTSRIGAHEAATTPASSAAASAVDTSQPPVIEREGDDLDTHPAPVTDPEVDDAAEGAREEEADSEMVIKGAGADIGIHIETLQETAASLQDFAAAPGDRQAVQARVVALLNHAPDAAAWSMLAELVDAFVAWGESKMDTAVYNALFDEIEAIRACFPEPPKVKVQRDSRAAQWEDAVETLQRLKDEYEQWLENLPDNFRESRTAEMLEEIVNLDLEDLANVEHPRGFGRD